jgi:hypothetical protein
MESAKLVFEYEKSNMQVLIVQQETVSIVVRLQESAFNCTLYTNETAAKRIEEGFSVKIPIVQMRVLRRGSVI